MVSILPEQRQPSFSERFAQAFGNLGRSAAEELPSYFMNKEQAKLQDIQRNRENQALSNLIGKDVSNILDPKMRQELLSRALQEENAASQHARELIGKKDLLSEELGYKRSLDDLKNQREMQQKHLPLQSGLDTIRQMKQIGKEGRLGRGSAALGFFGGQTAKDRAKYSRLGKSLISLSSNIPIRNQKEFEVLAHDLYDPSLPDDAREGILEAMEDIIRRSMQEEGMDTDMEIPGRRTEGRRRSIEDIFG